MASAFIITALSGAVVGTLVGTVGRHQRQKNNLEEINRKNNPLATKHKIEIKTENSDGSPNNTITAINKEILSKNPPNGKYKSETNGGPTLAPGNGNYTFNEPGLGEIIVVVSDDRLSIETLNDKIDLDKLHKFVQKIYEKHFSADVFIPFYTHSDDSWIFRTARKPRLFKDIKQTEACLQVYNYVKEQFKEYPNKKIGMLFYGDTRAGKTTMIQVLAGGFHLNVNIFSLNCKGMDDSRMINLTTCLRPGSILVLEELDIQLESMIKNSKYSSIGGLLTAIDGAARLPPKCLLIITTTNRNKLMEFFPEGAMGPGRIDKEFEFKK